MKFFDYIEDSKLISTITSHYPKQSPSISNVTCNKYKATNAHNYGDRVFLPPSKSARYILYTLLSQQFAARRGYNTASKFLGHA